MADRSGGTGGSPPVAVVVLNWNGWPDAIECLQAVARLDYEPRRTVVVDNGSTDDSVARIREAFPDVELIETGANLGFAGGCNAGIREAIRGGAAFVWVLNNDTRPEPGALRAAVNEAIRDGSVGIVGSVLRRMDGSGRVEAWGGGSINRWVLTTRQWTEPHRERPDHILGASMLLRRELLADVGLFDEGFFFYFEDTDLSRRATARGWKLAVARDSVVFHRGGATVHGKGLARSDAFERQHVRGSGRFIGKHAGSRIVVAVPARLVSMALRRLRTGRASRIPALAREFIAGVMAGRRDRRGTSAPGPAP